MKRVYTDYIRDILDSINEIEEFIAKKSFKQFNDILLGASPRGICIVSFP